MIKLHEQKNISHDIIADKLNKNADHIRKVMNYRYDTTSLDKTYSDQENTTLKDFISDHSSINPLDDICEQDLQDCMEEWFEDLSTTEKKIIRYRFGYKNSEFKTLDGVSKKLGMVREKIRQVQIKSANKLKIML